MNLPSEYFLLICIASMSVLTLSLIILGEVSIYRKENKKILLKSKLKRIPNLFEVISGFEVCIRRNSSSENLKSKIDFIIFTTTDILLVNYVDYKGFIYGSPIRKKWWCLNSSKKIFLNPLEKAYLQRKTINRLINGTCCIKSFIVFSDVANLDYLKSINENAEIKIMNEHEFLEEIEMNAYRKAKIDKKEYKRLSKLIHKSLY
ncbi:nuclease-related domain-containing protein [Enterococcus cecorum]|uniref:nuclease-related domain-containing protein n=1 Tax=Enterococcus cecorum TaxID=44008 RepID=UPI002ACAD20A|nr:nuclease-related domain-containing protein [Enterococcus cecorum]MDZ5560719.1 nuclease-related domain-containing protein [Enterococcus cecorum]